jgi:hypothetical protein
MPRPINSFRHRRRGRGLPRQLFNQGRTEGNIMIGVFVVAVVLLVILV